MYNFAILDLGTPQLILILAIVLLLFGGKKLPELSRSLGHSMRELRSGLNDDKKADEKKTAQSTQAKPENSNVS